MCFSPCLIAATQRALTQQRLLRCRTCGSQAFHILDCCRNPDYVPVGVSRISERVEHCVARVKTLLQAWWPQSRRYPVQPAPVEALDLWETRPLVTGEYTRPSPDLASADAAESEPCEMSAARR